MIEAPSTLPAAGARLPRGQALRRGLAANPLLLAGGLLSALIVVIALLAPLLAPFPGDAGSATHPFIVLHAPSAQHWFGTDNVGRDVYSRVLYGARISPLIAVIVLAISCAVGITTVIIVIALTWWPWYTRLIRGQAASVAGRPYIDSCRALGISRWRIIFRHILPNSITPLIVQVSLDVGGVILTVSALSFLGLGAQDPTPDWGLMVSEGQNYFTTAWWVVTFPGIAILMTAFAFTLLVDGLRDLMDPKRVFLR